MKLDKKTMSSAAAYILGMSPMTKIKGSTLEIKVFSEVLESSRVAYSILCEDTTIGKVSKALADKSVKARAFKKTFRAAWPF